MLKYFRGTVLVALEGVGVERCLNRWTARDIPFWDLKRESELSAVCRLYAAHRERAAREAARAQCRLRVLETRGLPVVLARLRRRPVLALGVPLVLGLALYLQNFVWFLQVRGNETVPDREILRALSLEGVDFGAWGPDLDTEYLKNRMLNRVPRLRWLAVNREGGVVTVLAAEREPEPPAPEPGDPANVVAARAGVVRSLRVINGFAAVEPGDPVIPGDLLISGWAAWTTHDQITRAEGEVLAETLREKNLICPPRTLQKTYTGRTERCRTIIFQRNRRKLSGNSSIFGGMCDKMIETETWTLPGGYVLPVTVETLTLREYTLTPAELSQAAAEALLQGESLRLTQGEMVAGQVLSARSAIQKKEDGFHCRTELNCLELISRTVPMELFREEAEDGEDHQRRTD